jgi:hypothetical protein
MDLARSQIQEVGGRNARRGLHTPSPVGQLSLSRTSTSASGTRTSTSSATPTPNNDLLRSFTEFSEESGRAVRAVEEQNKILRYSTKSKAFETRIALAVRRGIDASELEAQYDKHLEDGIPE